MYKLLKGMRNEVCAISTQVGNVLYSIPLESDNTDYQAFKKEVLAGAELQDADGNVMTQANEFIGTLP